VGSGPGGGVIAKELAERGLDVILLEEGPPFGAKDFRPEASDSMRRTMRESGMRVAPGTGYFTTMQAIGLGGGSLVNSAISIRAPGWALDQWAEEAGVSDIAGGGLDADYQSVEDFLGIGPTPDEVMGERNRLFKRGCDALGWSSEPTPRNVRGCKGSAECFTGCRNGAKQSTDISYVPAAIKHGARVYASVRAEQILGDKHHAKGIRGRVVEPFTGKASHEVEILADYVVLAAGCMASPVLMMRSGIGVSSGHVGEHLRGHPGLAIVGIWDYRVNPSEGATQGYQSLHFLKEGMKLEVLWAPPAVLSIRFPGFGHELKEALATFDRMAPFDVFIHAKHSGGRVQPGLFGSPDPRISFTIDQRDMDLMKRGLVLLSEICFAAGAIQVLPGLNGVPDVLRSREELPLLANAPVKPTDSTIGMNHVFGTTRMGTNHRTSVVDSYGKCHDVDNLYIADTGVFAGSPAVNPMLTAMALARRTARFITSKG
jgi:choline dehydrogenase-like flavoprotein